MILPGIGAVAGLSGGGADVELTDQSVTAPRNATYTVGSDGKIRDQDSNVLETWLLDPTLGAASYQVKMRQISGAALSGGSDSLAVWLSLSTSRSWTEHTSSATVSGVFQVSIRDAATQALRAAATITITAT